MPDARPGRKFMVSVQQGHLHAGRIRSPDPSHRTSGSCRPMTKLLEILREEHRNIETLLRVLERELNIELNIKVW